MLGEAGARGLCGDNGGGQLVITVACVMRSGGDFTPEHVWLLKRGVNEHLQDPFEFRILTDCSFAGQAGRALRCGYPGWWSKLELFAPWNQVLGDVLYFDLDTMIVGPLHDLATAGWLTVLRDFYKPSQTASGMMFLPAAERPFVWERWAADPIGSMQRFVRGGDGAFLNAIWSERQLTYWQDAYPGQVVSYKVHVRPSGQVPPGARVVCYHGRPRPWSSEHPTRDELLQRTASSLYAAGGKP